MLINKSGSLRNLLTAAGCLTAIALLLFRPIASASSSPSNYGTVLTGRVQTTKPATVPAPASKASSIPKPGETLEILAQAPVASPLPTPAADVSPTPASNPGLQALPQNPDALPAPTAVEVSPTPNAATEVNPTPTPVKRSPNDEPGDPTLNTNNSFWLDNYPLNDLFQYLARQANYQFFQNPFIDAIKVTGELFKGNDPLENMRELALQYNLILFQKGRTLYALTQDQIATLPQQEFRYELKFCIRNRRTFSGCSAIF